MTFLLTHIFWANPENWRDPYDQVWSNCLEFHTWAQVEVKVLQTTASTGNLPPWNPSPYLLLQVQSASVWKWDASGLPRAPKHSGRSNVIRTKVFFFRQLAVTAQNRLGLVWGIMRVLFANNSAAMTSWLDQRAPVLTAGKPLSWLTSIWSHPGCCPFSYRAYLPSGFAISFLFVASHGALLPPKHKTGTEWAYGIHNELQNVQNDAGVGSNLPLKAPALPNPADLSNKTKQRNQGQQPLVLPVANSK